MPHVSLVESEEAEGQVVQIYGAIEQNFGKVLNLIKGLGNSEPALRGFANMIGSMDEYELEPALRELAYLKTAQVNNCKY